jgi:hypothetical protein
MSKLQLEAQLVPHKLCPPTQIDEAKRLSQYGQFYVTFNGQLYNKLQLQECIELYMLQLQAIHQAKTTNERPKQWSSPPKTIARTAHPPNRPPFESYTPNLSKTHLGDILTTNTSHLASSNDKHIRTKNSTETLSLSVRLLQSWTCACAYAPPPIYSSSNTSTQATSHPQLHAWITPREPNRPP